MASLAERIAADATAALKQRDTIRVSTLRMLRSEIKYAEIANLRPATDEDVVGVIRKGIKQRQDSIEQYARAGRDDLVAQETAETEILQSYLPVPMDAEAIRRVVREVISQSGATGPSDMGTVMRGSMERLRDYSDGRTVQTIVREELAAQRG